MLGIFFFFWFISWMCRLVLWCNLIICMIGDWLIRVFLVIGVVLLMCLLLFIMVWLMGVIGFLCNLRWRMLFLFLIISLVKVWFGVWCCVFMILILIVIILLLVGLFRLLIWWWWLFRFIVSVLSVVCFGKMNWFRNCNWWVCIMSCCMVWNIAGKIRLIGRLCVIMWWFIFCLIWCWLICCLL